MICGASWQACRAMRANLSFHRTGTSCACPAGEFNRSKDQREQAEKEPSLRFLLRTSHAKDAGSIIMENLSSKSIAIQCYERQ